MPAVPPEMIVKPDEADLVRLRTLEADIRKYDPGFDFNPVREAYDLVKQDDKILRRSSEILVDHFTHDPLLLPLRLVKDGKPSSTDILTALLYPWIRPANNSCLPQQERMQLIEQRFGRGVRTAVEDTLRHRALKFFEPKFDPTLADSERRKKRSEHLRLFRLMGLWMARSTTPILIMGKQLAINLEHDIDYRKKHGRLYNVEKSKALATVGRLLYAQLAYIAGYEEMRDEISDLAYQLQDPDGYKKTKEDIGRTANSKQIQEAKRALIKEIEQQFGWKHESHFTVEIRPKPAYSTRDKADRKQQPVTQLGDLCGARIILKKGVVPGADKIDWRTLAQDRRDRLYKDLGAQDLSVYAHLAGKMGRGNRKSKHVRPLLDEKRQPVIGWNKKPEMEMFSPYQARFAELAIQEPRALDPGRYDDDPGRKEWEEKRYPRILDARFDDYVARPKASGYSGYQDTLLVPQVNEKGETVLDKFGNPLLVELECQIVDEVRHDYNMTGQRAGRVYYKTDLAKYTGEVIDWFKRAGLNAAGRFKGNERVYVIDDSESNIVNISKDPTVRGFFAATGRAATCPEARIYDGIEHANYNNIYGHDQVLANGSRVCPLALACG